jgi:hypothetical protein
VGPNCAFTNVSKADAKSRVVVDLNCVPTAGFDVSVGTVGVRYSVHMGETNSSACLVVVLRYVNTSKSNENVASVSFIRRTGACSANTLSPLEARANLIGRTVSIVTVLSIPNSRL